MIIKNDNGLYRVSVPLPLAARIGYKKKVREEQSRITRLWAVLQAESFKTEEDARKALEDFTEAVTPGGTRHD